MKILLAAALAATAAAPLAAQNAAPAAAPQAAPAQSAQNGNTPEDRARAAVIFRTFSIALNSDKVRPEVKSQLVACMYNNPMRTISVATGRAFARNTGLDAKKPEQVYAVAAQLCGVKPAQSAAQQAAPGAKPKSATGR